MLVVNVSQTTDNFFFFFYAFMSGGDSGGVTGKNAAKVVITA